MKRIMAALFVGFMFLVSASYNAYAEMRGCMCQSGGEMHGRMGMPGARHGMWRLFKELGLNGQQREEVRGIGSRVMKETIRKRADIRIARIELKEILQKNNADMSAVEAKLKQIASFQTDVRLAYIKAMEEIKSKLTPEQRTKFMENLRDCRGLMHKSHRECMCQGMGEKGFRGGKGGM